MKLTYYESTATKLLSEGFSKVKIAEIMQIKSTTLEGYISRARRKLECKSNYAMVLKIKELQ